MQDQLIALARQGREPLERLNRLREQLHHLILQEADRCGAFQQLCFVGGTALRILHGLDRFSEDLDFSVFAPASPTFDFARVVQAIHRAITAYGFACTLKEKRQAQAVASCFFSFDRLLHAVHPSFRTNQRLAIKWDVDCRPPHGAIATMSPVTGIRVYTIRHYDLPSLFAGKLHAVLCRAYTKGRDIYDLLWYLGKRVPVNTTLLGAALAQSQGRSFTLTRESLQELLTQRLRTLDLAKARADVQPFLEDPAALRLFDRELLLNAATRLEIAAP